MAEHAIGERLSASMLAWATAGCTCAVRGAPTGTSDFATGLIRLSLGLFAFTT
jgi:hypothetical protein